MKRKRSIGLSVGICLLLLGLFSNISVFAAVTEGKAGETLTGEYAVIVNTDPEVAHNTGTLVFDDGADGTAPYTAGSVGASNSLGSVNVAGGSTNSAIALQSATTYTIGQEKYMGTTYSQKTYVCIGIGEHCYIWMEKNMKSDLSLIHISEPTRH